MKLICKQLGGSNAYGLNTPSSDIDWRGVFLNSDLNHIIGLDKYEHVENTKGGVDEKYKEFRHFMNMLRKSNTEAMEIMFNDKWEMVTPEFLELQKDRLSLIDVDNAFKCLCGYMQSERKLMNGERTGLLGSKRKEALDKYGYSYKNAVHILRLGFSGAWLFEKGNFPVNVMEADVTFGEYLLHIKTHPQCYTKEQMNDETMEMQMQMEKAYDNRNFHYKFDLELANRWVYKLYMPLLEGLKESVK